MLYHAVRDIAQHRPQEVAVRRTTGEVVTYEQLCTLADRVAGGLRAAGAGHGDVVALSLDNSIGYVATILAVARLGGSYVPMIREFDDDDIRTALGLARPRVAIVDDSRRRLPGGVPTVGLAELSAAEPLGDDGTPPPWGVFRMLWTSGSTGFPKMMAWRQDAFLAERRRWIRHTGITASDVVFCRHPLDVAHATDLHVFAALLAGGTLVLHDPFDDPGGQLRALAASEATVLSALPRHYELLVEAAREAGAAGLDRLRLPFCGGTYVSPQVIRDCDAVLGVRIRQLYGSTEFGLAAVNLDDVVQTDADMSLVRGVTARLAPLAGVGGQVGEFVLRSAYTSEGYLNNAEAHARTFRDGEYWTGDVAQRNADGSYRILGRVSEALAARDGLLLAPMLDERIEGDCPVRESVTLPLDPDRYGNEVVVVVQPEAGVAAAAVERAVRGVLDRHGLAGAIHVVDELPYTAVGKPHKSLLRTRWVPSGDQTAMTAAVPPLVGHRRHGRTPTLLMLPGWGMTSAYFDGVVADLGQDHDVVTVDLRGHGGGPEPLPGWSVESAAHDVHAVLDKLELTDVTLLGWSLGAGVAYSYLDLYGTHRVSRLVSVEMSPRLLTAPGWDYAAFGGLDEAGALQTQRALWADPHGFLDGLVRGCFAAGSTPDPDLVRDLVAHSQLSSPLALLTLWIDAVSKDWREQLSTVTVPTLLIHGAHSTVFPPEVGAWLRDALPNAHLEMFAHSGHLPFLEEPEKFSSVLRDFLKENR